MLKNIWLYSLRCYLKVGLFFYFKEVKVVGKTQVPTKKSLLVLGNHQSALIDPLLLAVTFKQYAYYLTRAGVFQKKWVRAILNSVNMLPVYRIRDGWSNISNNNPVFEACTTLLNKKQTIVIFPEGSHSLARTVRPLSKGFTRIILDTLERHPDTDLYIQSVGFNYQEAASFPDSASIYFGKPIRVKPLLTSDVFENTALLKDLIQNELQQLTTHVPSGNYEETILTLEELKTDYLHPQEVNACVESQFKCCGKPKKDVSLLSKLLKPLVYLNLCLPILFWRYLVKSKIKEPEFVATFRYAVSMVLIPLWLLGIGCLVFLFFGTNLALAYITISFLLMLGYVKA